MLHLKYREPKGFYITCKDFREFVKDKLKDPGEINWTEEKVKKAFRWVVDNVLGRRFYKKKGADYILVRDTVKDDTLTGYVSYVYNVRAVQDRMNQLFGSGNISDCYNGGRATRQEKLYMMRLLDTLCNNAEDYVDKPPYNVTMPVVGMKPASRGSAKPIMFVLD